MASAVSPTSTVPWPLPRLLQKRPDKALVSKHLALSQLDQIAKEPTVPDSFAQISGSSLSDQIKGRNTVQQGPHGSHILPGIKTQSLYQTKQNSWESR